jgi:hypothetical protein
MRPQLAFAFIFVTVLLDSIGFGIIMPVVPHLIMDISGDTLADAARVSGLLMFTFAVDLPLSVRDGPPDLVAVSIDVNGRVGRIGPENRADGD